VTALRTPGRAETAHDGGDVARSRCELTLFISGPSEVSERAIASARKLCDVHLAGRARLAVVDVRADVNASLGQGILATPTLARTFPLPIKKIVGEFSDTMRVLEMLGLRVETGGGRR
jgi:circadian clock protein KaiB